MVLRLMNGLRGKRGPAMHSKTRGRALAVTFVIGPGSEDSSGIHMRTPLCLFNVALAVYVDMRTKGNAKGMDAVLEDISTQYTAL